MYWTYQNKKHSKKEVLLSKIQPLKGWNPQKAHKILNLNSLNTYRMTQLITVKCSCKLAMQASICNIAILLRDMEYMICNLIIIKINIMRKTSHHQTATTIRNKVIIEKISINIKHYIMKNIQIKVMKVVQVILKLMEIPY